MNGQVLDNANQLNLSAGLCFGLLAKDSVLCAGALAAIKSAGHELGLLKPKANAAQYTILPPLVAKLHAEMTERARQLVREYMDQIESN